MPNYAVPGVYVVEESTLPPSVAEVATAIPAFIGYTANGTAGDVDVAQINTLLEYELRFGKARPTEFKAKKDGSIAPAESISLTHVYDEAKVAVEQDGAAETLADIRTSDTALYNQVKKNLAEQRVTLPPSAAMAGIYARVDRERGVWKAPANVGVMSVIGPSTQISHDEQEKLNVDETSGKSINAIRAFAGRGTLVWGARTLAGNDNEWRYVSILGRDFDCRLQSVDIKYTAFDRDGSPLRAELNAAFVEDLAPPKKLKEDKLSSPD